MKGGDIMGFFDSKSDFELGKEAAEHVRDSGVSDVVAHITNDLGPFSTNEFKDGFTEGLEHYQEKK